MSNSPFANQAPPTATTAAINVQYNGAGATKIEERDAKQLVMSFYVGGFDPGFGANPDLWSIIFNSKSGNYVAQFEGNREKLTAWKFNPIASTVLKHSVALTVKQLIKIYYGEDLEIENVFA